IYVSVPIDEKLEQLHLTGSRCGVNRGAKEWVDLVWIRPAFEQRLDRTTALVHDGGEKRRHGDLRRPARKVLGHTGHCLSGRARAGGFRIYWCSGVQEANNCLRVFVYGRLNHCASLWVSSGRGLLGPEHLGQLTCQALLELESVWPAP